MSIMSSSSVTINFAEDYSDVVLLDVSDDEIRTALTEEMELKSPVLCFKGGLDAVLCTKKSTFALFSRETSNELFLVSGNEIKACGAHRMIEPCRVLPRLHQLKRILAENAITDLREAMSGSGEVNGIVDNDENDENETRDFGAEEIEQGHGSAKRARTLRLDDIQERVQASEDEIMKGLKQLGAVEIQQGSGWRILSRPVEEKLVRQFLEELKAQDFDVANGDVEESSVVEWLCEFPSFAVRSIYRKFVSEAKRLDTGFITEYVAESLLLKHRSLPLSQFSKLLKDSLPESIATGEVLDIVKQLALLSEDKATLTYFPAESLPKDARKRCETLFALRPFWSPKDLEAFLEGVDGGVADAVQKYARSSTSVSGERGYVKR